MGPSAGLVVRWIWRFAVPNLSFLAITLVALAAANSYFGWMLPRQAIVALALLLNPASIGAVLVFLILGRWERYATRLCEHTAHKESRGDIVAGIQANRRAVQRIESLLGRWSPLKAGVYLAFFLRSQVVSRQIRLHQVNTTSSADADIIHQQAAHFYAFQLRMYEFITSLAMGPGLPRIQQRLDVCFDIGPLHRRGDRIKKSVNETYADRPGFMSTLHFLFHLSLCLALPKHLQEQVISTYEGSVAVSALRKLGWLTHRLFEYVLLSLTEGREPKDVQRHVRQQIKRLVSAYPGSDPDEFNALKWEIRDELRSELASS